MLKHTTDRELTEMANIPNSVKDFRAIKHTDHQHLYTHENKCLITAINPLKS